MRPPAELRAQAGRLVLECPDCPGLALGVHWSDEDDAWHVKLNHLPTCPSRRSRRRRRAAERWLLDQVCAVVPVSQYGAGDVRLGHWVRAG